MSAARFVMERNPGTTPTLLSSAQAVIDFIMEHAAPGYSPYGCTPAQDQDRSVVMTPDEEAEAERLYRIRKAVREREQRDAERDAERRGRAEFRSGCGWLLAVFGGLAVAGALAFSSGQLFTDASAFLAFLVAIGMLVGGIALIRGSKR